MLEYEYFKNLVSSSECFANKTVWNICSIYDGSALAIYIDEESNITLELNEVHYSD